MYPSVFLGQPLRQLTGSISPHCSLGETLADPGFFPPTRKLSNGNGKGCGWVRNTLLSMPMILQHATRGNSRTEHPCPIHDCAWVALLLHSHTPCRDLKCSSCGQDEHQDSMIPPLPFASKSRCNGAQRSRVSWHEHFYFWSFDLCSLCRSHLVFPRASRLNTLCGVTPPRPPPLCLAGLVSRTQVASVARQARGIGFLI